MHLAPDRPNVELRKDGGEPTVVLAFPYDARIVAAVRGIPHRRFDWDRREWLAPVDDWVGVHVADVLARFPELTPSDEARAWLEGIERRWVGRVGTTRHDGRGWWVLETRAGTVPDALRDGAMADPRSRGLLVPLTRAGATELRAQRSARLDAGADRCVTALELDEEPPPAQLVVADGVEGLRLRLEVLWDHEIGATFEALPGAAGTRTIPIDPWVIEFLDPFLAAHPVAIRPAPRTRSPPCGPNTPRRCAW